MKTDSPLFWTALLLALGAGASFIPAQAQGDRIGYKDTIVVAADETRDNVIAFGGDVVIEGKVRKAVFVIGGSVTVSGEVGDAVVGIGSRMSVKSTAVIRGDLVCLAGSLVKEPGFRVEGDTIFFKASELTGKIFKEGLKGILSVSFWPVILVFKLVNVFIWFLLALVMIALFPRQAAFASNELRTNFWPIFGTGLVALILFIFLLVFSAVLCLLLIGIPILLSLILAGLAVKIFGRIVLLLFVGESVARAFNKRSVSPLGGALLGLLVLSFIGFIPVIGFLMSFVLSVLGWGIALRTKFGTTSNWFKRSQPVQPK